MSLLGNIGKIGLIVGKTAVAIKLPVALPIFAAIERLVNKAEDNHPKPRQGALKHAEVLAAAPEALEALGIDRLDIDPSELDALIKLLVLVKQGKAEAKEEI